MMADERGDLSQNFTVGSHVKCRFQGSDVEGEVAAFQNSSRLVVIKAPASSGKSSASNIYIINTEFMEKLTVHDKTQTEGLKPVNTQKLEKRKQKAIGLKKARIRALSADVAPEGRQLFLTITKTIDEVVWEGEKILVLNEVWIAPPYRVDNVSGEKDASVTHVRKIVEKHWKEQSPGVNRC